MAFKSHDEVITHLVERVGTGAAEHWTHIQLLGAVRILAGSVTGLRAQVAELEDAEVTTEDFGELSDQLTAAEHVIERVRALCKSDMTGDRAAWQLAYDIESELEGGAEE